MSPVTVVNTDAVGLSEGITTVSRLDGSSLRSICACTTVSFVKLLSSASSPKDALDRIEKKFVVGYDTRFLSDRFAAEVARVLAANGFTVMLVRDGFSQLVYQHAISTIMPGGSPLNLFEG